MRILVISTWCPYPPNNGSKIRANQLIKALSQQHDVTLVAYTQTVNDPTPIPDQNIPEHIVWHPVPQNPFRYTQLPQIIKFLSPIPLSVVPHSSMQQVIQQLASLSWDAVVAIEPPATQYALQLSDVPRIVDIDVSLSYQPYLLYSKNKSFLVRGRYWLSWQKAWRYERKLYRAFRLGTVALDAEAVFLQQTMGDTKCQFLRLDNGTDCRYNHPHLIPPRPNHLVFNGALTYFANYDAMRYFLAEIYPYIRQCIPTVTLTITGDTTGVALDKLELDQTIHFTGHVPDVRLPIAEAAVCVVPLRLGGGTRLKILEAMALGIPVVSTFKGAEGLEVRDGIHLLLAEDAPSFAAKVVDLLQHESARHFLARNARQWVEKRYDWQPIGQQFVAYVEELVAQGVS